MAFQLTQKQEEANDVLGSPATSVLLYGGSRSSKTFTVCRAIIIRAQCAPGSRHAIVGFRFNRIKTTVGLDTLPKVFALCFPDCTYRIDKSDWYFILPNGSEIWLCGLDDKERTEKVLGKEFATIFFNECSQISNESRQLTLTRLAQKCLVKIKDQMPVYLRLKAYYDCNPPKKRHWTYKLFIKKIEPEDNRPLSNPEAYASLLMNPADNLINIGDEYWSILNSLSASKRRRFRDGQFGDDDPNQLFSEDDIEKWRVLDYDELPDMVRIVVAVDPSGTTDDENNDTKDDIGIVIAALGVNGIGYILEDRTVKLGPSGWGKVVAQAYEDHDADIVIGEDNFGGGMVKFVVRTANPRVPYKSVRASRGKCVRAEPIAPFYADGRIRHVGYLRELEEELTGFTTSGYTGDKSPNRGDAAVWAAYALFPHLTKPKDEKQSDYEPFVPLDQGAGY